MFLIALLSCAHTSVVWEFTPESAVVAPSADLSIVAADARCQAVADALAREVAAAGLPVTPTAPTRMLLNLCSIDVRTELDLSGVSGGLGAEPMNPARLMRATGSAVLTIEVAGAPQGMLNAEGSRVLRVNESDADILQQRARIHQRVTADLAHSLTNQIWPQPVKIHRRWFRDPEPGSWQASHNQAVTAERTGRCVDARDLASEAVERGGRAVSHAYLNELRSQCPSE